MATTSRIGVRVMADGDVAAVARLLVASGLAPRSGLVERLRTAMATAPGLCLVAAAGRKPVGAALASFNGFHVFLSHLVVVPRLRNHGFGRRLHVGVVARATRLGAREIIVDARLDAVGYFGRLGYRRPGAVFLIRRPGR